MLKMMLGAALASAFVQTADAQAWPTRPVTMVVPFAAGGTTAEHVCPAVIWIPTPDSTQLELVVQVIGPGVPFCTVKLT